MGLLGLSLELRLGWRLGGGQTGVGAAIKTTEAALRAVPVQLAH